MGSLSSAREVAPEKGIGFDNRESGGKYVKPALGKVDAEGETGIFAKDGIEEIRRRYKRVPDVEDPSDLEALLQWLRSKKDRFQKQRKKDGPLDYLTYALPATRWLRNYSFKQNLLYDLVAGISISAMIVPHGLSYASLNGGLPPVFGLYNGFVTLLIYSAFGSCRTLSVYDGVKDLNPVYTKITDHNNPKGAEQIAAQLDFNTYVIQVTFLVGVIQLLVWALRLSFLLKLLSRSVMSGFTTAVSVIFITANIKNLVGYSTASSNRVYIQIYYIFKNIRGFQWQEFVMGGLLLLLLFFFQFLSNRNPRRLRFLKVFGPLTAMVIAIVLVVTLHLDKRGIKVVGKIPKGLPPVTVQQWFPMKHFGRLLTVAITAAAVSLLDANAIGKVVAAKGGYKTDNSGEFLAISLMNLVGPIFSCTATSGNFSRTAVWTQIGGKTQLGGFVTAWIVALCLLVATGAFRYIPNNTLAAITIYGLSGLFDGQHALYLWKVGKTDFLIWNLAFWVATMHSVELGLGASIGASILFTVLRTISTQLKHKGEVQDSSGPVYRSAAHYGAAELHPSVRVVAVEADIYFPNVEDLQDSLAELRELEAARGNQLSFIILDLSASPHIDPTAIHFLKEIIAQNAEGGVTVLLANPSQQFQATLQRAGVLESVVGAARLFVSARDAVSFAQDTLTASKV
ncbi:hypothetical protein COCSUDRAFT_57368 [Coccomyxa subellipsoidea C-169]|uniref:STAS domain-containing protein n=1 Tax=Coccomyxa subellipsoidea (strain C-169) TaxID=574566 RepID=I0YQZ7_COCSC|nr:hypothetical protein COCSUDRAFT_57368 [Coccomyxa subellipsoidea C-169]EIE20816.1 hypothetical protein COCSUDRAFT_57368 [Coccomyxa subellipsoidea C-169]|eukprot:XP_005645360.1 hypothetical protein COCSUDRAFT_57368 [Coccomyxa subellipsoidea C-169]